MQQLFGKIDIDNVEALNEVSPGSGKKLIRPWDRRLEETEASSLPHRAA